MALFAKDEWPPIDMYGFTCVSLHTKRNYVIYSYDVYTFPFMNFIIIQNYKEITTLLCSPCYLMYLQFLN